jgi:predicted outer membrane protein
VKDEATGAVHKAKTGSDGRFAAAGLPAGVYSIEASAQALAAGRHGTVRLSATGTE